MPNSVKLLNYVDPDGEYIKFYTELNSDFNIGDKVFIIGGHYDNTYIAKKDPYHKYAAGYTVVSVDKTNLSNSVTLNISNQDETYLNSNNTTLFAVYNPYYTKEELDYFLSLKDKDENDLTIEEKELLERGNFSKECWISKSNFKIGEFNGGTFNDGIFGEYNIYDNEYKTYFNRKYENNNAIFLGGVFVGGNWQYGVWDTKYDQSQYGKLQKLNELGGIRDLLNSNNMMVTEFNNNNNGQGWNIAVSGNFGRIWTGELSVIFDSNNNTISFNYIPLDLKRALLNNIVIQLNINILNDIENEIRNKDIFTINFNPLNADDINLLNSNTVKVFESIYMLHNVIHVNAHVDVTVADPEQHLLDNVSALTEKYKLSKSKNDFTEYNEFISSKEFNNVKLHEISIRNNFSTGEFLECNIYNGFLYNLASWKFSKVRGGNWYYGEVKYGKLGSDYSKFNWYNGFVNGSVNRTIVTDTFWHNGVFLNAVWDGAQIFKVKSLSKVHDGTTNIELDAFTYNKLEVGDTILMSYFKYPNSIEYLPNWTNEIDKQLLEFQTFKINSKVLDDTRALINIDLNLNNLNITAFVTNIYNEQFLDLNYQYSRISNSFFNKGIWVDGTWNAGYLNGKINKIYSLDFDINDQTTLKFRTDSVENLKLGDYIELTNVKIIHLFDFVELLPGTNLDDRNTVEYWQNCDQILKVKDVDLTNNIVTVDLSNLNNDINTNSQIIGVSEYYENSITGWTYQVWEDGIFNSGVLERVVWKNGIIKNIFVEDSSNTQIKSIWRSGVWKNGEWDNGVFLSGIWENGEWMNGYMTNGWNRGVEFWTHNNSWQISDSVWMNGTWHNGRWIRGMWNDGTFINGVIENAGIDKIEIVDGTYSNGRTDMDGNPVFSTELNVNRTFNAAPSFVYMDSDGWIQLDQSSWYQRDYNIIFKDLNFPLNGYPWNDQMFDVLDRDKYASKIKIDVEGYVPPTTSGEDCNITEDTKDILQSDIDKSLPIVALRNIVAFIELKENVYWIADGSGYVLQEYDNNGNIEYDYKKDPNDQSKKLVVNGYNRIFELDLTDSSKIKLNLIQKVLNNPETFNIEYGNILNIKTDKDSNYIYVLEYAKISKINKQTFEISTVITLDELKNNYNLDKWFNFSVFPGRQNIPETLFIYGSFINGTEIEFNILNIYPNDNKSAEFINYQLQTYKDIFNAWMNELNSNGYSFSDVIFEGFSEITNYILYEKLPINVDYNSTTYLENNIQRQQFSYDVITNTWNILNSDYNICSNTTFEFVDFIVSPPINNESFWLLNKNRKTIYYSIDNSLTPLINDFNTPIKSIYNSENNILAVAYDNISPYIIPKYVTRLGFGISNVVNNGLQIDYSQYVQRTTAFMSLTIPDSSNLTYWIWDYPTYRLIKIDQSIPTLYTEDTEFGVDPPKINKIIFLNKSEISYQLLFIDETTTERVIKYLNLSNNSISICCAQNTLSSMNISNIFINAIYLNNKIVILYEDNGIYCYDIVNLIDSTKTYNVINTSLVTPSHILITNELFDNNVFNKYKTYLIDKKFVTDNYQTTVTSSGVEYVFVCDEDEYIINGTTYSVGYYNYMYIVTYNTITELYNVYRLTKHNISDFSIHEWPVNVYESVNGHIYLKPEKSIYQTSEKILNIKAFVETEIFDGIELLTDNSFVLLKHDYDSYSIKGINQVINTNLTDNYYISDASNRIIELTNASTSGTVELAENLSYGHYLQPFQYDSYIRNASSLNYVNWVGSPGGKFLIYIDEKIEKITSNNNIIAISNIKKYIKAIDLTQYYSNQADVNIVTIFDGDKSLDTIKDPWGNDLFGQSSTSSNNGNYEIIGLWTNMDVSNLNIARIYFLTRDIDTNEYVLIRMDIDSFGTVNVTFDHNVASNLTNVHLKGLSFNMKDNDVNSQTAYVYSDASVYQLDHNDYTNAVEQISFTDSIIDNVVIVQPSGTTRIDYIFIKSADIIQSSTSGINNQYNILDLINKINNYFVNFNIYSYSSNATQYKQVLKQIIKKYIIDNNVQLSDIVNLINKIKEIVKSYNYESDLSKISKLCYSTVKIINDLNSNDLRDFGINDYEMHLYSAVYAYSNDPLGTLNVMDDDGSQIIRDMTNINVSIDKTSLLINNLNEFYAVDITYDNNTPEMIYAYNILYTKPNDSDVYSANVISTTELPEFKAVLDSEPLFNAYYKEIEKTESNLVLYDLYSPFVSGRVLKNMIWRDGQWNYGSDTRNLGYTAFLVSSKWLSGNFNGSWDTPDYFNHSVINEESMFIGGIFGNDTTDIVSSTWHNGLFLGGTWVSGYFNKGHFISDLPITAQSISFTNYPDNTIVINQVYEAQYDVITNEFRLDLEHFYYNESINPASYEEISSFLVRNSYIFVPGLFQNWKIYIREIRKVEYQISGKNEIVLIADLPYFDVPENWLKDNYIYILGVLEYTEYLHGYHYVTHSFTYNNKLWITIQSDFNKFDENGRYVIDQIQYPYISLEPLKIKCVIFNGYKSSIYFDIPIPKYVSTKDKLKFLKQNVVSSSLDIIDDELAIDIGSVVSPERAQVFTRSVIGTSSIITLNNATRIKNTYFNNVTELNYISGEDISDIVLINSNLTTSETNEISIINSLIYSGDVSMSLNTSGWLNYDENGFCNANSNFTGKTFNGDYSRIINFYIESSNEYVWIELEKTISNISKYQYIYLRGFTGNKARIIGSTFSQPFRILDIKSNLIKIRNPFKLYNKNNILTDTQYKTSFNVGELTLFKQSMFLEVNYPFTFYYTYASNSAWNGGTFKGFNANDSFFNSVWNAGLFDAKQPTTTFNGEMFGTPHSYYYTGTLYVKVVQDDVNFKLIIDLIENNINYNNNDLIYVEFENNTPPSFYARVVDHKLSVIYPIYYPEGNYIVQMTRYRAANETEDFEQLILDQNLLIGPEKSYEYDLITVKNTFDYSGNNTILNFKPISSGVDEGVSNINIKYVLKSLSSRNIIFDAYVSLSDITTSQTILYFKISEQKSTRIILTNSLISDANSYGIQIFTTIYQDTTESTLMDAYNGVEHVIDDIYNWYHLYVEYDYVNKITKIVLDANDMITVDYNNDVVSNGSWIFIEDTTSYELKGILLDKNVISNIVLGQGHENSKISYQGSIDNIRFWNIFLNDGLDGNLNEIEYVKNKRFMSYSVKQIDAKITFDDRINEFTHVFKSNAIRLFEVEYINNILMPHSGYFVLYVRFKIDQLLNKLTLFRFTRSDDEDHIILNEVLLHNEGNNEISINIIENSTSLDHICNITYSKYYSMYISQDRIVVIDNDNNIIIEDKEDIDLSYIIDEFSIGNAEHTVNDYGISILNISNIILYKNAYTNEIIDQLINNKLSSFKSEYIDKYVNIDNFKDYSNKYYVVDPATSSYPTLIQSTTLGDHGSILVDLVVDYENWEYLYGEDIFKTRITDSKGTNLELWGTNGQQITEHRIAEIFDIYPNGELVWDIDNVSWKTVFRNGTYTSKIWRTGILDGGTILSNDFIWKWGINNGGNIFDAP